MELYKSCQTGNLVKIKEILENSGNNYEILSQPDVDGIPSLHWAALNGRWLVCKYLLDHGVFVDALGGDQEAPAIHWAICKGHASVVSLFLRYGADWRVTDSQGYNSMHVASQNGQEMIILLLKAQGADINTLDRAGRNPLLWAAYRGHVPVTELLIKLGADLNQQDANGRGPLHWAIIKGQATCSAKLAKAGAAFDLKDVEGKLPADWAREKQISWFDKLQTITVEYRKSQTKKRGKSLEIVGTRIIPSLITPILILTFSIIPAWWWSTLIGSLTVFALYNISSKICIPPEFNIQETSFLAYYNYSTLTTLSLVTILVLIPNQILINPFLSITCVSFTLIAVISLYKLKSADPGKLALPRSEEEKDETICLLASEGILDKRHFCTTCSIRKPLRSKHCKTCDRCVSKFDHHCPWINNCVGFHNHRCFMTYLYSCIGIATTFIPLAWNYIKGLDQSISRSPSCFIFNDQLCKAAVTNPVMFWMFNFGAFMTFWVLILTVTQTYQILRNLTTNELSNYSRLEYFYPELNTEDVPFEQIKDSDKSKRYINIFDEGILLNWSDFWKHPLNRKYNFNIKEKFEEEDLRHARIKTVKKGKFGHERSISATSIPLIKIKNFINNNLSPKSPNRNCCQHDHHQGGHSILQSNTSKQPLLEGFNIV